MPSVLPTTGEYKQDVVDPVIDTRRPRSRYSLGIGLVFLGLAVLCIVGLLAGSYAYASSVPTFHADIALPNDARIVAEVVAGCPPAMQDMACRHVAAEFPRVLRVSYHTIDGETILARITLGR